MDLQRIHSAARKVADELKNEGSAFDTSKLSLLRKSRGYLAQVVDETSDDAATRAVSLALMAIEGTKWINEFELFFTTRQSSVDDKIDTAFENLVTAIESERASISSSFRIARMIADVLSAMPEVAYLVESDLAQIVREHGNPPVEELRDTFFCDLAASASIDKCSPHFVPVAKYANKWYAILGEHYANVNS